jgi:diguanylate cyclase (GGDEF)-like protein
LVFVTFDAILTANDRRLSLIFLPLKNSPAHTTQGFAVAHGQLSDILPGDFLEAIRCCDPKLEAFRLILFHEGTREGERGLGGWQGQPGCQGVSAETSCNASCPSAHEDSVRQAIRSSRPLVFRCPGGVLHFAVPFLRDPAFCLLGALRASEAVATAKAPARPVDVSRLPDPAWVAIETIAAELHARLPGLLQQNVYSHALVKTRREIEAVHHIGQEIDRCKNAEEILQTLGESLIVLLNLSVAAIFLTNGQKRVSLQKIFGITAQAPNDADERLAKVVGDDLPQVLGEAELADLFPGWRATRAVCLPLQRGETPLGLVILSDSEGLLRDLTAAELLIARAADRLLRLRHEEEHRLANSVYQKLIAAMNALARAEKQEDICRTVLQTAASLVGATTGSLMLLDESGQSLFIEAAVGMNLPLARSLITPLGSGIAGKVAKSGFPLLVNDIEKDLRIATPNRPRYQTKSFISLPMKARDTVFGVLNLSDRADKGIFTEAELHLLSTFADHAALMIEKAYRLERASQLEALSVTDPLTGLYNRRFLERRMEEELSRCQRLKGSFSLLLLDMDNFKAYNDSCGHLAGDHALRRTAALLRSSAREMDVVTRFGGEEFCIILPDTGKEESNFFAERIRRAIEKEPFPQEAQLPSGSLTASIGIATFPGDGHTAISLLGAADQALYQAKGAGRNRVVAHSRPPASQEKTG